MRKLLVFSSVLLFNLAIMSQSSQTIIIGTFGVGNPDSAFYFKTNLENSFGFNTKFTNFLFPIPDTWYTYTGPVIPFSGSQNFSSLTTINNIGGILGTSSHYLANGKRNTDDYVRNFDWLYYFTGGLYSVWPGYDNSNSVYKTMLKHITGNSTDSAGYWSSGSVPGIMAYGPTWGGANSPQPGSPNCGYKQETRYRASGSYFTPDSTEYEAKFNILPFTIIDTTGNPIVCSLLIIIHYYDTIVKQNLNKDTIVNIRALDLLVEDKLKIKYNLGMFHRNINQYDEHPYIYQKTEFQVHWVGGRKILLKDIEVYDVNIYGEVFLRSSRIGEIKDSISDYLSRIKSHSSSFYNNNFKYHQSVDEPHTRDLFPALKYVNRVLDTLRGSSLGTAPKLFTHFYPEWNGYWDNEEALTLYYDYVKPDPFIYYYHYSLGDEEQVTMFYNWLIHKQASTACGNKPFHFVIDVWDQPNVTGGQGWRAPSKSEMTAAIMGALSFGCKGIYYEPFFSYGTVKGLVELDNNIRQYVPNELGYFVKDSLNIRLSGPLGITLNKLKYTDSSATIRFFYTKPKDTENIPLSESGSAIIDYLKIENNLSGGEYFFHAGLLEDSIDNSSKYFMLCNLYTDTLQQQRKVKITIASATDFVNHTLSDIESVYPDTTINRSNNFIFTRTMKPGDATLYRIVPVVLFGGNLIYNETINAGCTLKEKALRVKAGATLTINANYTCSQDIIVEAGGKLVINPGKTLTFTDGAKLRVFGKFISRGTSNNPININLSSVNVPKLNGVYLDSLSVDTLEYTNISNSYFGIYSHYTNPYISDCNISNTRVGIYLDCATYQPDLEEGTKIISTSVYGTVTGIDFFESSAMLVGCDITSGETGVKSYCQSFPVLSRYMDYGLNKVEGLEFGFDIYYSDALMGYKDVDYYGYNSITKSFLGSYDLIAEESGNILAQECWWGESTPNTDHFGLTGTYLDYEPPLDYDPFPEGFSIGDAMQNSEPGNKSIAARAELEEGDNPTLSVRDKYKLALRQYLTGNKNEARLLCQNILSSYPDSAVSLSALYLLQRVEEGRKDSLIRFLGSLNPGNFRKRLFLLAKLKLAEYGQFGYYPEAINGLLNWYPDSDAKPYLLFKKLKFYNDIEKNVDSALLVRDVLISVYPEHRLTREAKILLGMDELQKTAVNIKAEKYIKPVLENYPNPFNPSTTIRYGINTPGEVNIGIYNILGELVQTLVNEEKEKGIYSVILNSGRLSSGVYICRMISPDGVLVRKIMLLR